MASRAVGLLALLLVGGLSSAASASAATASISASTLKVVGGAESDSISIEYLYPESSPRFSVSDLGNPITPGPGCVTYATSVVECPDTGIHKMVVKGAGGKDLISIDSGASQPVPASISASLLGGSGDDDLYGGLGDDLLVGGGGSDRMSANKGADRIDAKDGHKDRFLDCGPGVDRGIKRDRGLDPHPKSCG